MRAVLWSTVICVFIPPRVKERDREKKGMKNRKDAEGGWNTWAVEKSKCTEHSAAPEWLNDPILGSLLDTRQQCMKIDTQVLDSVCWIIKRIDIILQPRMKTKQVLSYSMLGLVRGGKSSSVTGYGSVSQTVMRIYLGDTALYGSLQLMVEAPAVP